MEYLIYSMNQQGATRILFLELELEPVPEVSHPNPNMTLSSSVIISTNSP